MKKVYSLLAMILTTYFAFSLTSPVYASDDIFSKEYVIEYMSDNKADIITQISNELNKVNENSINTITGKIEVREPFSMPKYRCVYNDIKRNYGDELYSVVSCGNQALGLLKFIRAYEETPDGNYEEKIYTYFYYISENSCRTLSDGISFFYLSREDKNPKNWVDGGVSCTGIYSVSSSGSVSAIYYDCEDIYSDEVRNEYENSIDVSGISPDYEKLSDYNNTLTNSDSIIAFNYKHTDNAMKTGKEYVYRIRSKTGKYLTAEGGKFYVSDYAEENTSQCFVVTTGHKGGYTISPLGKDKISLKYRNSNNLTINTSYFDGYCSVIGVKSANSFSVLTLNKQNKIIFEKYHSDKYEYYTQDWFFEAV